MVTSGIETIFSSIVELFGLIYTGGHLLFSFFSSPIVESLGEFGPGVSEILGDFAYLSPFEIMFGPVLLVFLVLALARAMSPI